MRYEEPMGIVPKSRNRLHSTGAVLAILAAVLILAILATSCGGDAPAAGQPPASGGSTQTGQTKGQSSGEAAPAPVAKPIVATTPTA